MSTPFLCEMNVLATSLTNAAVDLLKALIATPSMSREEGPTADLIAAFLTQHGVANERVGHNVWAKNRHFDPKQPTLLLNSHHDTVRPNASYTRDPFAPAVEDGKLYGLGSNDAGGCLVSLLATFVQYYDRFDLTHNLVMAATAEEEISGRGGGGIESLLPHLPLIDVALVGEPTQMNLAIAEKGLLVLDCTVRGRAGHAARNEGENAITNAMPDLTWFQTYQYPKISPLLGSVKQSVTIIQAGTQHNVVPDTCIFTVDVRVTEQYTLEEILVIIRDHVQAEVTPRSVRLRSSGIAVDHPLVQAGLAPGRTTYGSPTLSDQALLPMPSLKCGPGHSERSHIADEFIYLSEIEEGIVGYVAMLERFLVA